MRIGVNVRPFDEDGVRLAVTADEMGVDSLWSAEAWGYDALTPLAYVAARTKQTRLITGIAQLGARTPAMLAMSAMSMQALSGGRFVLGMGSSGPQVIEGWHGVPFAKPVTRTRETIEIIRSIASGERSSYDGKMFQLPLPGGEGKAIRSMAPPAEIPIYLASLGPANLKLTGELADGWIGNSFLAGSAGSADAFIGSIREGAEAVGRSLDDLDLTVAVSLEFSDDVETVAAKHAGGYAFTFGAMGSQKTNFYSSAFARQGFGPQVAEVHRLWQAGDREAAAKAVPPEIGLRTNLIGTDETIRETLDGFARAGISTIRVGVVGDGPDEKIAALERLMALL